MKTKTVSKIAMIALCSSMLSANAMAAEITSQDKKIYFGIEGGYSVSAKNKFKEKTQDGVVIGKLAGTGIYEAKMGYKFYPGFALELAYAYRPKYILKISFPDQPSQFGPGAGLTNSTSSTHVQSHTVMLNLLYEAQTEKSYRPYFLFGLGYAHVTPKKSPIYGTVPAPVAAGLYNGNTKPKIGSIKKFTSERLGWRVGTGLIYDLNPSVSLVSGVKLEVINNIGLHTEYYNPDGSLESKKSLKKTIGVVDFTVGARVSL